MKRVHLAWLWSKKVDAGAWRPLRFDVPLLQWTAQVDIEARDRTGATSGDPEVRAVIWSMAGELFRRRHDSEQRRQVRGALAMLRRAWVAHSAGRADLSREMFALAQLERSHATSAVLGAKAGAAWLAEQRRVSGGKKAHRGKPETLSGVIRKAIAANPSASNRAIAELVDTSEASVRRRRGPSKKS